MTKIVRLICIDLIVLYLITRLPVPLLFIPVVGAMVIFNYNEVKEIKDENKTKKRNSRNKKVKKQTSK